MSTQPQHQAPPVALGIDTYGGDDRPIDWARVLASGISFAIIKASDGYTTDEAFMSDREAIHEAGLSFGAYHFLRPSKDPNLQAAHLLNALAADGAGLLPTDFPVCVDVELNEGKTREGVCACVRTFVNAVRGATGRALILYTSPGFAEEFLDASFGDLHLWVSHYTSAAQPTIPAGWSNYLLWQFAAGEGGPGTDVGGPVPLHPDGCPSPVDSNRAFASHAELLAHLGIVTV